MIITVQTSSVKEVLNDAFSGPQSVTVEGVIHDLDCGGDIHLQFTSAFDNILLERPALDSTIF